MQQSLDNPFRAVSTIDSPNTLVDVVAGNSKAHRRFVFCHEGIGGINEDLNISTSREQQLPLKILVEVFSQPCAQKTSAPAEDPSIVTNKPAERQRVRPGPRIDEFFSMGQPVRNRFA